MKEFQFCIMPCDLRWICKCKVRQIFSSLETSGTSTKSQKASVVFKKPVRFHFTGQVEACTCIWEGQGVLVHRGFKDGNWFSQAGKTFLTEPFYKKTLALDGQTRQAKPFSQRVNLPGAQLLMNPLRPTVLLCANIHPFTNVNQASKCHSKVGLRVHVHCSKS